MITDNSPILANKYHCESCDYSCCKNSDFKKHLSTLKHNMISNNKSSVVVVRYTNIILAYQGINVYVLVIIYCQ